VSEVVALRRTDEKIRNPCIAERVNGEIEDKQGDGRRGFKTVTGVVRQFVPPASALLEEHLGERAPPILRKSTQDEQETVRKLLAEIVEERRYVGKIWMRPE
jgi:hypothetical protein